MLRACCQAGVSCRRKPTRLTLLLKNWGVKQVGSLSIRRALDSCSWNELESRYASLEEGHDGRLATNMWLTSECKYKQV